MEGLPEFFPVLHHARLAFVPIGDENEEHLGALGPAERSFFDRLRFPKRRRDWLAGRLAAKAAVGKLLGRNGGESQLEILPADSGEPVLHADQEAGGVRITISHSGEVAGAAAYRHPEQPPMGLDIERIEAVEPALYPLAFREEEMALIEGRTETALRLWTVKEAVLKAIGSGLRESLHGVEVKPGRADEPWTARVLSSNRIFLVETLFAGGYVLSLAAERP